MSCTDTPCYTSLCLGAPGPGGLIPRTVPYNHRPGAPPVWRPTMRKYTEDEIRAFADYLSSPLVAQAIRDTPTSMSSLWPCPLEYLPWYLSILCSPEELDGYDGAHRRRALPA